ncbi:MAG: hypothetical protein KDK36_02460, partial [Leptospiraceae bacterium]|nr:hypothetical protein [Leptospiraceae bacterium]
NLSNNVRRVTALYGLQRTQELSDKYDTQVQRTNTMLLIMGGIYIIQLVDAYLIERKLNLSFDNSFFEKYQFSMSPVKIGNQVETKYDFGYTLKF